MMQPQQTYVKNGLVLWLDGIDKGNVSGSWVDKVSGYEFAGVNNPTFGTDYVELDRKTNYLVNSDFSPPTSSNGTIEVVATGYTYVSGRYQLLFMPKIIDGGGIALGLYGLNVIWSTSVKPILENGVGFEVLSVNEDRALSDGTSLSFSTNTNNWGSANTNNYIGCRAGTGVFYGGKIHSIRIYNRKLTADEILNNQRVDNKRFNLRLNI